MNILAIETSSSIAAVAVMASAGQALVSHAIDHDPRISVSDLCALMLERVGLSPRDLDRIAVDIGPGGLSAVRAGVSFANALAFAVNRPLFAFSSFEIAARQGLALGDAAVVLAVPAAGGHAYLGRVQANGTVMARYGLLEDLVPSVVADLPRLIVMGRHRRLVRSSKGAQIIDSGVDALDPMALLALCNAAGDDAAVLSGFAEPLNEQSELFHG
ncbi:hypothetical protein BH10PSE2_BH10PSE2_06750 [soil metagenome]